MKLEQTVIPLLSATPISSNDSIQSPSATSHSQNSSIGIPSTSVEPTSSRTTGGKSLSTLPSPSLTFHQSPTPPITNSTNSSSAATTQDSQANKGLVAGLGLTLGFAITGFTLFAIYKYNQRRRQRVTKAQIHRTPDLVPDPLPTHPIETNGYTEWEMATNRNTHEAPTSNDHRNSRYPRGRNSRLWF